MNIEFEVKNIMRSSQSPEEKANEICSLTNFKKDDVILAIRSGGEKPSDIYRNLLLLNRKRFKNEKDVNIAKYSKKRYTVERRLRKDG